MRIEPDRPTAVALKQMAQAENRNLLSMVRQATLEYMRKWHPELLEEYEFFEDANRQGRLVFSRFHNWTQGRRPQ